VMTTTRSLLLVLGITAVLLVTPRLSLADGGLEGYCCVCTGCSSGASRQCISVEAIGTEEAACMHRCTALASCQFLEVLDGQCGLHASECTPSPAPAASQPVLFAMGILLAGGGVYLVRRRMTH